MTIGGDGPIRLAITGRIATATICHPPVNLIDSELVEALLAAIVEAESEPDVTVFVVQSDVPGFFAAHYDLEELIAEDVAPPRTAMGEFNRAMERIRTSSLITIGQVRGAARGGGCELLLALDMRFASRQLAVFSQPEAVLGILAAGGGTQRLPELIGRARALELLLGGDDIDAETAERYGLVNRSVPDAGLDEFVSGLVNRLAAAPPEAIRMTKLAVDAGLNRWSAGFGLEALELDVLKWTEVARVRMRSFLEAGGQTRGGELDFQAKIRVASNESIVYDGPGKSK